MLVPLLLGFLFALPTAAASSAPRSSRQSSASAQPEIEAYAARLETALRTGDTAFLDRAIDHDALLARATLGLEMTPSMMRGFTKGISGQLRLGSSMCAGVKDASACKLLRVSEQAGIHRALFRVALDGRLDYHEYELARAPDGSVHIVDGLLYSVGERMSDSARRAAQVGLKNENQGVGDVLSGKEQRFDEGLAHFQRFQELAKREQWSPALEEFEQLPADLLQLSSIGLLKVRIASHLSEQRWLAAVEEFRTAHPGDPALDLLLLQVHRARREFEPWLACVDRLDRKVGGDPYLQLERGDAHFAKASLDRARTCYRDALRVEPDLEDAYWRLASVALAQQDHAELVRLLTTLENDFHVRIGDLTQRKEYAAFVASKEYEAWSKPRR